MRKLIFIPNEPHHDYGYIDRVYVITKAGYITKCGYPDNTCVWVEENTILVGARCSQYSYGIAMAKEKARPWVDKKKSNIIEIEESDMGTRNYI